MVVYQIPCGVVLGKKKPSYHRDQKKKLQFRWGKKCFRKRYSRFFCRGFIRQGKRFIRQSDFVYSAFFLNFFIKIMIVSPSFLREAFLRQITIIRGRLHMDFSRMLKSTRNRPLLIVISVKNAFLKNDSETIMILRKKFKKTRTKKMHSRKHYGNLHSVFEIRLRF